jgi:hypothetical protein
MANKKKILNAVNIFFSAIILLIIFIASTFWLGSKEHHEQAVNDGLCFFFTRLAISLVIVVVSTLLLWLINIGLKKILKCDNYKLKKVLLIEIVVYTLCSLLFVIIGM